MKLAKLSLAAMVVAGLASSSFAADTLADAFAKGKVSGELRAWYWDRDNTPLTSATIGQETYGNESIFNTALILNYVTDSFYGFSMGATMQSNFAPFATSAAKDLYGADEYGSGTVLSEAYLAYTMKNTTVKVGRQFITTPLVSGSGSRIVKEAFEGAVLSNTDLPQTTLAAGYVTKMQARTTNAADGAFSINMDGADSSIPSFQKTATFPGATSPNSTSAYTAFAFDGAYTGLVINKSIPNLTLTGAYAAVNDIGLSGGAGSTVLGDAKVYNVEANYVLPMSGFSLGFDAIYRTSKTDDAGAATALRDYDGGEYYAARVGIKEFNGFGVNFAYGQSAKDRKLIAGLGSGADNLYTGALIRGGTTTYGADTDSYKFEATYDFSKVGIAGLTALAQYAVADQGTGAKDIPSKAGAVNTIMNDYKTTHFSLAYAVPALKGLTVALQYESQKKEAARVNGAAISPSDDYTQDEYRFMANYKF